MAKTKEELEQIKKEYEEFNNKLKELSEEELKQVTGGGETTIIDNPEYLINEDLLKPLK